MSELVSMGLSEQASLWGLNVIIHTTVLTSISLLIAVLFRRAAAMRYWVLCFALVLVLVSPGISGVIQATGSSWLTVSTTPDTDSVAESTRVEPDASRSLVEDTQTLPSTLADTFAMRPTPPNADAPLSEALLLSPILIEPMAAPTVPTRPVELLNGSLRFVIQPLMLLWVFVTAILLLRMSVGWIRMWRILKTATPIDDECLQAAFDRACVTAGCLGKRRPQLVVSDFVSGPIAAGVLRGKVVLPASLLNQVDPQSLADVLIHEVAHVVRRDQIVVLLQNLVSAIYWPHPLVRKLNRELAKAREEVCDNFVLAATEASVYSRTLLSLAELVQRPNAIPGSVGFFTDRWKLENRISGLLDANRNRTTFLSKRGWLFVAASTLGLSALMYVGTITIATAEDKDSEDAELADLRVSGRVVDADGNSIEAMVAIVATHEDVRDEHAFAVMLAEGTSDADGQFRLRVPHEMNQKLGQPVLLASSPSSGVYFQFLDEELRSNEIFARLPAQSSTRIRLVTLEGEPVGNHNVLWRAIAKQVPEGGSYDRLNLLSFKNPPAAAPRPFKTDAAGWFEVPSIIEGYGIFLDVEGDAIVAPHRLAINAISAQVEDERLGYSRSIATPVDVAIGESVTVPLAPPQTFSGTVLLGETKQPAIGAKVLIWSSQYDPPEYNTTTITTTDAKGHFRLSPYPANSFALEVTPPDGSSFQSMQKIGLKWESFDSASNTVIRLPEGKLATGNVIDRETGNPIEGVYVQYVADSDNPNKTRAFVDQWRTMQQTDENGLFRVPALAGGGTLIVHAGKNAPYELETFTSVTNPLGLRGNARLYAHAFRHIELKAQENDRSDEPSVIPLSQSKHAVIRMQDLNGQPVERVLFTTSLYAPPKTLRQLGLSEIASGGIVKLNGIKEGESHQIVLWQPERKIGAKVTLHGKHPVKTAILKPAGSATIRIVDGENKPVAGQNVVIAMVVSDGYRFSSNRSPAEQRYADRIVPVNFSSELSGFDIHTNENGEAIFNDLIPDATYEFEYIYGNRIGGKAFNVEPGQHLMIGDIAKGAETRDDRATSSTSKIPPSDISVEPRPPMGLGTTGTEATGDLK